MRIGFVILGFLILIVGVFGYLLAEPTSWQMYQLPSWLRPFLFLIIGLGFISAFYGFIAGGEEQCLACTDARSSIK